MAVNRRSGSSRPDVQKRLNVGYSRSSNNPAQLFVTV